MLNLPLARRAAATASALVLLGSGAAVAGGTAHVKRLTWDGQGCVEAVAELRIPAARAAAAVPAPFQARLGNGGTTGTLILGALECERLLIGNHPATDATIADAGIAALDANGNPVTYHLWQVTGSKALRQRLTGLGMPGAVGAVAAPVVRTGPAVSSAATVGWDQGDYALDVAAAAAAAAGTSTSDWVTATSGGVLTTRYTFFPRQRITGGSTVQAAPGGALATLIGVERIAGYGLFVDRFDIRADLTLRS